jgi:predicted O-linked N-acetylglucosamine transferase (SPINDLY family)
MPDLVTADMQAYETRALALACDRGRLSAIKHELARNRHTHPLFDMERFTRALERTLGSALVA